MTGAAITYNGSLLVERAAAADLLAAAADSADSDVAIATFENLDVLMEAIFSVRPEDLFVCEVHRGSDVYHHVTFVNAQADTDDRLDAHEALLAEHATGRIEAKDARAGWIPAQRLLVFGGGHFHQIDAVTRYPGEMTTDVPKKSLALLARLAG